MTIVKLFYVTILINLSPIFTLFYGFFIAVLSLFFILDHSIIWVLIYSGLTCWAAWACSTFQALAQQIKASKPGKVRLCHAYRAFDRVPDAGCRLSWPGWPVQARLVSSGRAGQFRLGWTAQAGLTSSGRAGQLRLGWPVQAGLAGLFLLFPWPPWHVLARPGLPLGRGFPVFFIPWPARPKPGLWPGFPRLSGQALTPVFPGLAGLLMQGLSS